MPKNGGEVVVRGLSSLVRDFNRLDKTLGRDLKRELRAVAAPVAARASAIAEAKGLRDSGNLIRSVKPFATVRGAGIRETAKKRGYSYPAIYEYGWRGAGDTVGPRAFLLPAVVEMTPAIEVRIGVWLDRMLESRTL